MEDEKMERENVANVYKKNLDEARDVILGMVLAIKHGDYNYNNRQLDYLINRLPNAEIHIQGKIDGYYNFFDIAESYSKLALEEDDENRSLTQADRMMLKAIIALVQNTVKMMLLAIEYRK